MAKAPNRFVDRERVRFPDGHLYRVADDVESIVLDWSLGRQGCYQVEMKTRVAMSIEELVEQGFIVPVGEDEGDDDAQQ